MVMIRKREADGDELVLARIVLSSAQSVPTRVLGAIVFVPEGDVEGIFAEERANLVNLRGTNEISEVLGEASEEWVFAFRHAR